MMKPVQRSLAGTAWLVLAAVTPTMPAVADSAPVVVELFTSQGCYSCPPADELLGELAERDDVLPLGFHVTYWDRLGWPDTLGLEAGTARQEAYARLLGNGRMYTPQMVVQGQIDVVGSQRDRVMKALKIVAENREEGLELGVDGDRLTIGASDPEEATIWLAAYDHVNEVAIERGENGGKTLTYHNAVRELDNLGRFEGDALDLELPLQRITANGRDGAAILVQRDSDGVILAALRVELPSS